MGLLAIDLAGSMLSEQTNAARGEVFPSMHAIPMFTAMTAVHGLFACFVFANAAYYGGIVFGYRRLAIA